MSIATVGTSKAPASFARSSRWNKLWAYARSSALLILHFGPA
jgi:hypothetical protein